MRVIIFLFGILFIQQACVPSRVAEDLRSERDSLREVLEQAQAHNKSLEKANDSLKELLAAKNKQIRNLKQDTGVMSRNIKKLKRLNDNLNETYEKVISNKEEIISDKAEKTQQLLDDLNSMKDDLEEKEKALSEKEKSLQTKKQELDSLRANLEQRQKRVKELESVLHQKDSTLNALKKTVSDALISLKSSGLSVEMKNSKVYISLEEKLLFASGKYKLDQQGKDALDKISKVLKNNPNVNIMVEGHTDDQKVRPGSEMADNWELSVLRATEVVRYLTQEGGVDPERLIASGRGPHSPVVANDSPENRKKNRRTELILTPEMDKLFDILKTNP